MKAGSEIESIQNGNKNFCLKPVSLFREPFIFANPAFALPRRVVSVTGAEVDESFCFFLSKILRKILKTGARRYLFFFLSFSAALPISFSIVTFAGKPSFHILFFDTTERYFYRKRITNGSERE